MIKNRTLKERGLLQVIKTQEGKAFRFEGYRTITVDQLLRHILTCQGGSHFDLNHYGEYVYIYDILTAIEELL
jgi:hypothetical protein